MLYEQIGKDYVQAMKDRNQLKSSTLNFLRAQLKNVIIDKRLETLDDAEVITVIKKQIKQRQDSIAQYTQGGRMDLADKESAEMAILKAYLPQEMGEAEIEAIVRQTAKEVSASSIKDMGTLMKAVALKMQGKADNKLVSEVVKKVLTA